MQLWSFTCRDDALKTWRGQILSEIEATREALAKLVPAPALAVELRHAPGRVMPEIGMVGYAPSAGHFSLTFDSTNPHFAPSLADGTLRRQVAHEVHHCLRHAGPGYGQSLGEALVSEGLAGQCVNRLYGTPPEPWEKALAPRDAWRFLANDKTLAWPMYDHSAWFFGTGEYPRWLGYTLGYLLAGRWRALNPEASGAQLVNVTAGDVIAAARSFS